MPELIWKNFMGMIQQFQANYTNLNVSSVIVVSNLRKFWNLTYKANMKITKSRFVSFTYRKKWFFTTYRSLLTVKVLRRSCSLTILWKYKRGIVWVYLLMPKSSKKYVPKYQAWLNVKTSDNMAVRCLFSL